MIVGVFELGVLFLVLNQETVSLRKASLPLILGIILGIIVSLIEVIKYREKGISKYKPSFLPYSVILIILLLNIIFSGDLEYLKLYLVCLGPYLITLAVIFKIYESKTKQTNITWIELLDE
jgi:hypothetical protein